MQRSALVASLLAAVSCRPAGAQAPALVAIRASGTAADDSAPVLYALRAGWFRNAGIDLTYTRVNSGAATAAAVIGGAVDIGKSSLVSIINARARGIDLKLVAAGVLFRDTSPDVQLVVAPDSPIHVAKDLNGKTISVPALDDSNTVATKTWLDVNGGDSKSVQFIEVPATAAAAAVTQGRIAAATLVRPYLSRAVSAGQVRILANVYAAIATQFFADWLVYDRNIRERPSRCGRPLRESRERSRRLRERPPRRDRRGPCSVLRASTSPRSSTPAAGSTPRGSTRVRSSRWSTPPRSTRSSRDGSPPRNSC